MTQPTWKEEIEASPCLHKCGVCGLEVEHIISSLLTKIESEIEGKKTYSFHTPNCQRGTDKNKHFFCGKTHEDHLKNQGIDTVLSILRRYK